MPPCSGHYAPVMLAGLVPKGWGKAVDGQWIIPLPLTRNHNSK